MSLKDRLHSKSTALVRREALTLPETGEVVQVRGMMFGEKERLAEHTGFKQSARMIAMCVEDPETGQPLWNQNDQKDHDQIAALSIADTDAIVEVIARLSKSKRGKEDSGENASSPSPSPGSSAAPSAS